MTDLHVVVLRDQGTVYGPFTDETEAAEFADYLTEEVDPAQVRPLCSPTGDLLAWRRSIARPAMEELEMIRDR